MTIHDRLESEIQRAVSFAALNVDMCLIRYMHRKGLSLDDLKTSPIRALHLNGDVLYVHNDIHICTKKIVYGDAEIYFEVKEI